MMRKKAVAYFDADSLTLFISIHPTSAWRICVQHLYNYKTRIRLLLDFLAFERWQSLCNVLPGFRAVGQPSNSFQDIIL